MHLRQSYNWLLKLRFPPDKWDCFESFSKQQFSVKRPKIQFPNQLSLRNSQRTSFNKNKLRESFSSKIPRRGYWFAFKHLQYRKTSLPVCKIWNLKQVASLPQKSKLNQKIFQKLDFSFFNSFKIFLVFSDERKKEKAVKNYSPNFPHKTNAEILFRFDIVSNDSKRF